MLDLLAALDQNPHIAAIRRAELGLPDAWLVAGCLAQTVWNLQAGNDPSHGIADYDLVYFDAADLSVETRHETRLRDVLGLKLDVKNQARVHLWYEARFGVAIEPYASVEQAIATYPTTATAIGLRLRDGALHASFGWADLQSGIVRANRRLASHAVFNAKAARWRALWPHLRILPWEQGI
jgi:hypothetical protein